MLSQRITGDSWNPMRSLELGAFGFIIDGPLRHMLSQLSADNTAVEMAGKVSSKVHSVLDGKASWAPLLACVVFAALKAAEGDPAALLHSCEVCLQVYFCILWCVFSCLIRTAGYSTCVSCISAWRSVFCLALCMSFVLCLQVMPQPLTC